MHINPTIEIKHSKLFDVNTVTREQLVNLLRTWGYDQGSVIHGLLLQIAELKGYQPITKLDLNPDKTYEWHLCWYPSHAQAHQVLSGPFPYEQLEYLGCHTRNGVTEYGVMSWIGQRPDQSTIIDRMKQHGVTI